MTRRKLKYNLCWLCRKPIDSFIEETLSFGARPAHWWCHEDELERRKKAAGLREGKFHE